MNSSKNYLHYWSTKSISTPNVQDFARFILEKSSMICQGIENGLRHVVPPKPHNLSILIGHVIIKCLNLTRVVKIIDVMIFVLNWDSTFISKPKDSRDVTNPTVDGNENLIFRDLEIEIGNCNGFKESWIKIRMRVRFSENLRQNNGE